MEIYESKMKSGHQTIIVLLATKFSRNRSIFSANNTQPQIIHVDSEYFIGSTYLFAAEYFRLTTLFLNNSVVSRKYSAANK